MKANRKFIEAGEESDVAVSAVIGVILMVAITVAIAATVYVYVSGMISSPGESAPSVQFIPNESDDRITVTKTDSGVSWGDLAIRADAAVTIYINGEVTTTTGTGLNASELHTIGTDDISGGMADVQGSDWIDIEGTAAPLNDVTISIVHLGTNSVLQTMTLSTVAAVAD